MTSQEQEPKNSPKHLQERLRRNFSEMHSTERDNSILSLIKDFKTMYLRPTNTDCILLSGNFSFPVHKLILCARSEYFRTVFTSLIENGYTSPFELNFSDVDPFILDNVLLFIYTGVLGPCPSIKINLMMYSAAIMFKVENLKQECFSNVMSRTTVSNVTEILLLAHEHEDDELNAFANEFILFNIRDVLTSVAWKHFVEANPLLAGTTLISVLDIIIKEKADAHSNDCSDGSLVTIET